jgi:cyanophycinase
VIVGLLGSGEFEPWAEEVDRRLLAEAREGPVLVLPTASAPEGEEVFDRWARLGLDHYGRQGIEAELLPVRIREDAEQPTLADRIGEAAMVFFSGGNPSYLASALSGTRVWRAILEGMGAGLAYAGCSAGAAALGVRTTWRHHRDPLGPGLRLFPGTNFAPHWDAIDRYRPGQRERITAALGGDARLIGIDERTALVGDGSRWLVLGSAAVHVLNGGRWEEHPAGSRFDLDLRSPGPGKVNGR